MSTVKGVIYGLGLGPGDPDLMSVKADRILRKSSHVAYFRKKGRKGHARTIVDTLLAENVVEYAMEYPVTTEIALSDPAYNVALSEFYEGCAARIKTFSDQGISVTVLCEGDPFFYGSFMHIYTRVKDSHPVCVVPAITGMSAAWTQTGHPITWGDDVLTVLTGTLPEEVLIQKMRQSDALVIMKIGQHLGKVKRALKSSGLYERAWIVRHAAMTNSEVQKLNEVDGDSTPYFSIIIVHGQGRRP